MGIKCTQKTEGLKGNKSQLQSGQRHHTNKALIAFGSNQILVNAILHYSQLSIVPVAIDIDKSLARKQ